VATTPFQATEYDHDRQPLLYIYDDMSTVGSRGGDGDWRGQRRRQVEQIRFMVCGAVGGHRLGLAGHDGARSIYRRGGLIGSCPLWAVPPTVL
jgi:hypothetical protein